jgi:small subunit ribosomal protein S1
MVEEKQNEGLEAKEELEQQDAAQDVQREHEVVSEKVSEKEEDKAEELVEKEGVASIATEEEEATEVAEEPAAESEEFDWDALEADDEGFAGKKKKELVDLYDNTLNTVQEKEVLEGTVISMNKREVVVDIGYKSDGIVSLNEFRYNPELKVGDPVEVYVESLEDKKRTNDPVAQKSTCCPLLGPCE